jgi:1,4-dihydroxy-2-naphthoyl-CoA hydrolase
MTDNAATEMIHGLVPLAVTLGITADAAGPEEVVLSLDWAEGLTTGGGVLHGGIVMALADTSGAVCAFLNLPEGAAGTTTIESKTNFMRALTMPAGTAGGGSGPSDPALTMPAGTAGGGSGPSDPATRAGTVKAHSRPLHVGRRVIVVETEIRGENGKLAAKTIQSQAVL